MAVIHLINPYDGTAMGSMQGVGGRQVPLGLAYIAATLRKEGNDVRITDEVIQQDGLKSVSENVPDAILLSVYPSSMNRAKMIVKLARELNPKALVIAGGAIAQATTAESYMLDLDADVIVLGEGELIAPKLVKEPRSRWSAIDGIMYRDGDKVSKNPPASLIEDLDTIPFPAIDLLDMSRYTGPTEQGFYESSGKVTTSIMTARGCCYRCKFCASGNKLGRKIRYRSPENVVAEIEHDINELGIRHFTINDDTFTADISRVMKLCDLLIEKGLGDKIIWIVQTRAEVSTLEMFKAMRKAGCVMVAFGVESGSPKVLDMANKNLNLDNVRKGVKWAHEAGIRVKTYFIVNLPGETEEDAQMSIDLAKELDPDYLWLSYFTPLPGTAFFDELVAQGKITGKQLESQTFFTDNRDADVVRRYKRFIRAFYLRPGFFLRVFKRLSISELTYMARMGVTFVKIQLPSIFPKLIER